MVAAPTIQMPEIHFSNIVLPMPAFYGMIIAIAILIILVLIMVLGGRDVPSIGELKRMRRQKKGGGFIHFPDGGMKIITLEPELIGGNDTINKTFGKGKPTNYHRAEGLIKFFDTSGQTYERVDGIIPIYNLMLNIPESVAVKWAAILSALEMELREAGYNIDGVQDLFFYCLKELDEAESKFSTNEYDKSNGGSESEEVRVKEQILKDALANVLKHIQVHDEASKERVRKTIEYLYAHADEINYRINKPITFTWQSTVRAWDALQGATSRNVEQIKICAEEEAKLDQQKKDYPILMYGIVIIGIIAITFFVSKAAGWV